jgi:predicted nucleic acid-binding protein
MTVEVYVDTSALAKYYLREPGSSEFETFLRSDVVPRVSRLVLVEFRCLVARRKRNGTIDLGMKARILSLFFAHVGQGLWQVRPMDDLDVVEAGDLVDRLPDHPLRTSDALHLAAASRGGATQLATADRVMAAAAESLGLTPILFG